MGFCRYFLLFRSSFCPFIPKIKIKMTLYFQSQSFFFNIEGGCTCCVDTSVCLTLSGSPFHPDAHKTGPGTAWRMGVGCGVVGHSPSLPPSGSTKFKLQFRLLSRGGTKHQRHQISLQKQSQLGEDRNKNRKTLYRPVKPNL